MVYQLSLACQPHYICTSGRDIVLQPIVGVFHF